MIPELRQGGGADERPEVLDRLRRLCSARGLDDLAANLEQLMAFVATDMAAIETALADCAGDHNLVSRTARHLLARGGKRLRPLCVALAARTGKGFDDRARDLAVAAELIHNATLLHDDVIDMADTRRGAAAARALFGNAASIFAGDWLLIEALSLVQRAAVPGVLDRLLLVIADMIRAESLQLEHRGDLALDAQRYYEIAHGKSATLFRWALFAGAQAGGLEPRSSAALETFGAELGLAFQIIDDLLDVDGHQHQTGKPRYADLREGKITYPIILLLERRPSARHLLAEIASGDPQEPPPAHLLDRVSELVAACAVPEACRQVAASHVERATAALESLPGVPAREALAAVARSSARRLS